MPTAPDVNALVVKWLPLATGLARKRGARCSLGLAVGKLRAAAG